MVGRSTHFLPIELEPHDVQTGPGTTLVSDDAETGLAVALVPKRLGVEAVPWRLVRRGVQDDMTRDGERVGAERE